MYFYFCESGINVGIDAQDFGFMNCACYECL